MWQRCFGVGLLATTMGCGAATPPAASPTTDEATTIDVPNDKGCAEGSACAQGVAETPSNDAPPEPASAIDSLASFKLVRPAELDTAVALVAAKDWEGAETELGRLRREKKSATLDVLLHLDAVGGQIAVGRGDDKEASRSYEAVTARWEREQKEMETLEHRQLGDALNAVGEAIFYFADKKRRAVAASAMPSIHGEATQERVMSYVNGPFRQWMTEQQKGIRDAEVAFERVLQLKPVSPPYWLIASAQRVGSMWWAFEGSMRSAPYPSKWDQQGVVPDTDPPMRWHELRDTYLAAISSASEPLRVRAQTAYGVCFRTAKKFENVDAEPFVKACEEWLAENDPAALKH